MSKYILVIIGLIALFSCAMPFFNAIVLAGVVVIFERISWWVFTSSEKDKQEYILYMWKSRRISYDECIRRLKEIGCVDPYETIMPATERPRPSSGPPKNN